MPYKYELRVLDTLNDVCLAASKIFCRIVNKDEITTFIVPGGNTPIFFYQHLSKKLDYWDNINLILSDERIIDENNSASNAGMIKKNLIDLIDNKSKPYFVPIVKNYRLDQSKQLLHSLNKNTLPLMPPKAAFLGIGNDGHTASLFPGLMNENDGSGPFFLIKRVQDSYYRVSISQKILSQIPLIVFLIAGKKKKNILNKVLNHDQDNNLLPVSKIIANAKDKVIILCDREANPINQ